MTNKQHEASHSTDLKGTPGLKHVSFLLKAAHSLSKYHSLPPQKVTKLTIKYLKQKEKRLKEGMRYFLNISPKEPEMVKITHKVVLVCKALMKVISHKDLQASRNDYSYMNELD
jgi:hypothetical protein